MFRIKGDYSGDGDHAYVDHLRDGDGAEIEGWEERDLAAYTQTKKPSDSDGVARIVSDPTSSGSKALELHSGNTWAHYTSDVELVDLEQQKTIRGDIRHETDNSSSYAMVTGFSVGVDADGSEDNGIHVDLINPGSQRTAGAEIRTPNESARIEFTPELGEFYTFTIDVTAGITVEQAGETWVIEPLSYQDMSIEEFYNYHNIRASADTPTNVEEGAEKSKLFLYEGPEGLSLVAIHDFHNYPGDTASGGDAVFTFDGLEGSWVVEDDPADWERSSSSPPEEIHWLWNERNTDGGAFRFDSEEFTVTVEPDFRDGIDEWEFLSGDAESPDRIDLDLDEPVTIRTGNVSDRVRIDYEPIAPDEGEEITFDGSDTVGTVEEYAWDFGDDTAAIGETVTHSYDERGRYDVTLTVRRPEGVEESVTEPVGVGSLEVDQTREQTTVNSPVTVQVIDPIEDGYEYHWRVFEKPEGSEPHLLHGENYPETRQPSNSEEKPHAALRPDVASDDPYVLQVEVFDDSGDFFGMEVVEVAVEETPLDEIVDFGVDGAETVSELVELYAPTYHFHPQENYFPTRYEAYSENADVLELLIENDINRTLWEVFLDGAGTIGDLYDVWASEAILEWIDATFGYDLLAETPSLLELGEIADEGSDKPLALHLVGDNSDYREYQDRYPPTIHANVHLTAPREGPFAGDRYLAVTYWAFYLFDPKKEGADDVGLDDRIKSSLASHASDTETVTILIDGDGPQWIGAAQHYDGEYMQWEKVAGTGGPASIDVYLALGAHSSFLVNTDEYDDKIPGQWRWTPYSDSTLPFFGFFSDVTESGEEWVDDGTMARDQTEYDLVVLTRDEPWGNFDGEFTSDHGLPMFENSTMPQRREERFDDAGEWIPDRMHPEPEVLDTGRPRTVVVPHLSSDLRTFKLRFFRNPGVKPHTFVTEATVTVEDPFGSDVTSVIETQSELGWFDVTTIELPLDDLEYPIGGLLRVNAQVMTYSPEIATEADVVYETEQTWPISDLVSFSIDTPDQFTTASDREVVAPGDVVERTVTIDNESEESGTALVTLTAIDPDGIPHLDDAGGHEVVSVDPGEAESVMLTWTPDTEVPEGEYDLLTEVWDETDFVDRFILYDERTETDAITVEKPDGELAVATTPPDASVIIGGEPLAERSVDLPVGSYQVTALHEKFESKSESVTVEEGKTTKIKFDLVGDEPWIGDYTNARWIVTEGGLKRAERDWSRGEIGEALYWAVERAYERGEPLYEHRTPGDDQSNRRGRRGN